jgi:hypothetical protein
MNVFTNFMREFVCDWRPTQNPVDRVQLLFLNVVQVGAHPRGHCKQPLVSDPLGHKILGTWVHYHSHVPIIHGTVAEMHVRRILNLDIGKVRRRHLDHRLHSVVVLVAARRRRLLRLHQLRARRIIFINHCVGGHFFAHKLALFLRVNGDTSRATVYLVLTLGMDVLLARVALTLLSTSGQTARVDLHGAHCMYACKL